MRTHKFLSRVVLVIVLLGASLQALSAVPKEVFNFHLSDERVLPGQPVYFRWNVQTTGGISQFEVAGEQKGIIYRTGIIKHITTWYRQVHEPGIYQYKVRSIVGRDPTLWTDKATLEVYTLPPIMDHVDSYPINAPNYGDDRYESGTKVRIAWRQDYSPYPEIWRWQFLVLADYYELWVQTPRDNDMWLLERVSGGISVRTPNQIGTYTYGIKACNEWECSEMKTTSFEMF